MYYFRRFYKNGGGGGGGGGGSSSVKQDGFGSGVTPEILNTWVRGDRTSVEDFLKLTQLARASTTTANELQNAFNSDPKWTQGEIIDLKATSFTRASIIKDEKIGQVSWRSDRAGIMLIEKPKRGFDVPYDKVKVSFNAAQEKETIVAGRYRVKEIRKIPEPGTREVDGWTTKLYVLQEL